MKTGFIGLGSLGAAIASRLIERGVQLVTCTSNPAKAAELGIETVGSFKEVAEMAPSVILCLPDSATVEKVLTGENGLLAGRPRYVIDTTTNHADQVLNLHTLVEAAGADYLESPVIGSVVPAKAGQLKVLVSGKQEALDTVLGYFEMIGSDIYYFERPGVATRMKLMNNVVLGVFMAGIAEALATAESLGVPKDTALTVLANGAASGMVMNAKKQKLTDGDFSVHFSVANMLKDLRFAEELAESAGMPLAMGRAAEALFAAASGEHAAEDFSAVYQVIKRKVQ